jgi:hypothetical protein
VILDELGYLSFSAPGGTLLFHLSSKLNDRTRVVITTDLGFSEWNFLARGKYPVWGIAFEAGLFDHRRVVGCRLQRSRQNCPIRFYPGRIWTEAGCQRTST